MVNHIFFSKYPYDIKMLRRYLLNYLYIYIFIYLYIYLVGARPAEAPIINVLNFIALYIDTIKK
jgi:hypothetical protein